MSIFRKRTVEYCIREISELMLPVAVIINDTIELPNSLLFYETPNSRELLVQTRPGKYPKTGEADITFAYSKALYIFKGQISGIKK